MNKKINYDCFPMVRAVVKSCGLETQEQQEEAFGSLVKCLVSKRVCQTNGVVLKDRDECLNYLSEISSRLEEDEIALIISSPESFYERFIFAPTGNYRSLFSELQKPRFESILKNILVSEIFEQYRNETGYSPYEKVSKEELYSFLSIVRDSIHSLV